MEREELAAWLRLQLTPGVGRITARQLLQAFGLPQAVFTQGLSALRQVVTERQAQALLSEPAELTSQLETTFAWLQADPQHHQLLVLGDPHYPSTLLDIEDPPLILYALGQWRAWAERVPMQAPVLAIVGSRNPTPQGEANARQFAHTLAQSGWTIVSGMALGVDGAAHEGALAGAAAQSVATVAIVGTGLDRVYPRQHRDLAHRIAQRGVLLSEYPLGTPPTASNFPQRNRIISGLSQGTLVVEAALQSGSLITARLATEQGKEVFAIPGSIHATQARGCHALIKQGAKLVESAQDILEELQPTWAAPKGATNFIANDADDSGASTTLDTPDPLLDAMGYDPVGLDALQARTGLDTPHLQAQLMTLELQGRVARLAGGLFQRIGSA